MSPSATTVARAFWRAKLSLLRAAAGHSTGERDDLDPNRSAIVSRPGCPDWRGNRRGCPASMTRLCVAALFGALLSGGALAAFLGSGTIPPNLSSKSSKPAAARAQPARPAKQQLATVPKPAAAVRVAKPSAKPVVKPPVAVKVPVAPKIVVSSSTGAAVSVAAFRRTRVPSRRPPPHLLPARSVLKSPKPRATRRPPLFPNRFPANRCAQGAGYAEGRSAADAGRLPSEQHRGRAGQCPAPSAAGPATTASANPSKTGLNAGAVDKPVRTAYRTGSDGHVITLTSFQRPDGTIYETAISPAASPRQTQPNQRPRRRRQPQVNHRPLRPVSSKPEARVTPSPDQPKASRPPLRFRRQRPGRTAHATPPRASRSRPHSRPVPTRTIVGPRAGRRHTLRTRRDSARHSVAAAHPGTRDDHGHGV